MKITFATYIDSSYFPLPEGREGQGVGWKKKIDDCCAQIGYGLLVILSEEWVDITILIEHRGISEKGPEEKNGARAAKEGKSVDVPVLL